MRRSFEIISFIFNKRCRSFSTSSCLSSDDFLKIIHNSGYDGTKCEIETKDGYRLGLHKIYSKNKSDKNVFLMHGLFRNSIDFLASGKETALAYFLADQG